MVIHVADNIIKKEINLQMTALTEGTAIYCAELCNGT